MARYPIAQTSNILNAARLVHLAQLPAAMRSGPQMDNIWYLVAAAAFNTCNEPREIPLLYHFALLRHTSGAVDDPSDEEVARKVVKLFDRDEGSRRATFNQWYRTPTAGQRQITQRFRETLLKSVALSGLPRAINSLHVLAQETPESLLPEHGAVKLDERNNGQLFAHAARNNGMDHEALVARGLEHWCHIYGKVSERVANNLNASYPDLWYHAIVNVYAPLLSHSGPLDARETSLVIIANLVPQDVNAQLWGHLRGAQNIGCEAEAIECSRQLSIEVSRMCGVRWKGAVAKL
ncbi:ABR151Wp [Eremothecium gossypii ATCC 10895]|uniref:ABR151Wp n=1 Tax=Eremothecium gossypii (strain ATCC 10895 / CBS 109.51 / FGSC 9923 / NRRL Y-1056) TaxID=284811 RepID=Q75D72_EREGS|nr:ABR151Wp [Eremothecium gossypii ATCC 10895]AAS50923.1 ABR151Wp [Eremothecium gossypii ATCC 10895]AEY95212.1 FABR151Wp [Eremothecium gossypii FDAG1]